VNIKRKWKK